MKKEVSRTQINVTSGLSSAKLRKNESTLSDFGSFSFFAIYSCPGM